MRHAGEQLVQDVRHAVRAARRNPLFTCVAIATLALGIGANTAVFSVLNTVLLRGLPYVEPERLVLVQQRFPRLGETLLGASPPEYLDYRDRNRSFSSLAGYEDAVFDLSGGPEPVRVTAQRAAQSLFSTLGVAPLAGRTFSADDERPGALRVAVLSHEFWQRQFGGRKDVIGTAVRLDERPHVIVGVMPAGFEFPFGPASVGEPPALWVPLSFSATQLRNRAAEFPVRMVARLRPGVSPAQAEQDMARVAAEFRRERPDIYTGNLQLQVTVEGLGEGAAARVRPLLLTLSAAVVVVLLIACANVTNLLLARGAARRREWAVRQALGASAGRLIRQGLVEGVVLTTAGAALGCILAQVTLVLMTRAWPAFVSGLADARIDATVLVFTLAVSTITGVLCGIAPALTATRAGLSAASKQTTLRSVAQGRRRVQGVLVVLEASSAVVLLIVAGLLLQSLVEVLRVPIGFSPDGVLIARTTFNRQRYPSDDGRRAAERRIVERLQALPGVSAVGLTTHIPLADQRQIGFVLEGEDISSVRWADNALVSGEYFAALGIPILRGRTFGPEDAPGTPLSAIVNDSMARRFWPDGDALGERLRWGGRTLTIVGVAGDVRVGALDAEVAPTIYTPVFQTVSGATTNAVFVVRTRGEPAALARDVRDAVRAVDRELAVFDIRAMREVVSRSLETRRFTVTTLSGFSIIALVLATVGLYGMLTYSVAQRTPELGVRLALGATPGQVLRHIMGDGLCLMLAGALIGVGAGAATVRGIGHMLFGVSAYDLPTYVGAPVLLLATAALAASVPAWRASRVDPLIALRAE